MNKRLVLKILGATLLIEAATMLPSYVVALVYHDPGDGEALLKTILMMVFLGLPMWFLAKPRESNLRAPRGLRHRGAGLAGAERIWRAALCVQRLSAQLY